MPELAQQILDWQARHGRSGLPWQGVRDPYRVWLSEIMLQQTQVSTVIAYYARFLARFPDVVALAEATQDEVLALWAGLGYYSRARNLHACAKALVSEHGGEFPRTAAALQNLPGIGRSTAAAIAAFCYGERVAILDGNVRRVLARLFGFGQDLAQSRNMNALWDKATEVLPTGDLVRSMPRHTQAMMDLGATVCTARKPLCMACPVKMHCLAHRQGREEDYPVKTSTLKRRAEAWWLLLARKPQGDIFVVKRVDKGVWAGLYCLPVYANREELARSLTAAQQAQLHEAPAFTHVLTHKDLRLHLISLTWYGRIDPDHPKDTPGRWVSPSELSKLGLPAPLSKRLML